MNPRISESELIPQHLRDLLEQNPVILVSGRPLLFDQGERSLYYNDCPTLLNVPLLWSTVSISTIPDTGHSHIAPVFRGLFPILIGSHAESKDAYIFGVKPELNFLAQPQ